ncbi:Sulfate adenylyltransferase subunit 1 [Labeo rohita]|uniref:Sulfate adenylyltransferase subunit 1 n=1 Tax=Labeo rohita TaxID=84645 RepID=A0ABQ8LFV8_LABRO|nr:Sulfate adenylyltransferase subunit 1 [Labeo rohita]
MIMGSTLAKCAATDLAIQWVGWALASALKTEKFYDLAGSGTFIMLAHLSRIWGGNGHIRQNVQTGLVSAWGLRLGTFLFLRILKEGQDRRFNNVRDSPGTFFVYWTVQALWVFITLLPTLILNSERRDEPLGPRDYIGWGIWGLGFATEAIADQQKWNFRSDPDNAPTCIHREGLFIMDCGHTADTQTIWGEILQWSGLFLAASSVMRGPQYLSALSPLFVWFLLRHVSGIPILEKQAMKKWGSDPAFQNYIKNTPLLWPFPKFKGE